MVAEDNILQLVKYNFKVSINYYLFYMIKYTRDTTKLFIQHQLKYGASSLLELQTSLLKFYQNIYFKIIKYLIYEINYIELFFNFHLQSSAADKKAYCSSELDGCNKTPTMPSEVMIIKSRSNKNLPPITKSLSFGM